MENPIKEIGSKNQRDGNGIQMVVRILGFALTVAATIVIGLDKQTKIVSVKVLDSMPPLRVPATAEWQYLSSFKFFLASNAIACGYAAISLLVTITAKKRTTCIVMVVDVLMVALLCSSLGAIAAIGLIAYQGNSHVHWNKVCNMFGRFCSQLVVAASLSFLGTVAFVLLVGIAAFRLSKSRG